MCPQSIPFDEGDDTISRPGQRAPLKSTKAPIPVTPPVSSPTNSSLNKDSSESTKPAIVAPEIILTWGDCGTTMFDSSQSSASRKKVVRRIGAGMSLSTPPAPLAHQWKANPSDPARLEMDLGQVDPLRVRSLADLGKELRQAKKSDNLDHRGDQIAELDTLAQTLLELGAKLRSSGWSLGLLHAENVLCIPGSSGKDLILSDLGLTWRGPARIPPPWLAVPGRPKWLEADRTKNPKAILWDQEPVYQQFATANQLPSGMQLPSQKDDLRSLARLFAWVLEGQPSVEIAAPQTLSSPAPVWGVLHAACSRDSSLQTIQDFQHALSKVPLSTYFKKITEVSSGLSENRTPRPRRLLITIMLLAVILPLGAGVAYLASRPWSSVTDQPPFASTTAHHEPLQHLSNTLDDQLDELKKILMSPLPSEPAEREREKDRRDRLRGNYLNIWVKEYDAAVVLALTDVSKRHEAGKTMQRLHDQFSEFQKNYPATNPELKEEEERCLQISLMRAKELGV